MHRMVNILAQTKNYNFISLNKYIYFSLFKDKYI